MAVDPRRIPQADGSVLLSANEAEAEPHCVKYVPRRMKNGEHRFKLECAKDNSAYLRTVAAEEGAWQQSHVHETTVETYIVQSGWMAAAELVGEEARFYKFSANDIYQTQPGIVHNIYLPPGGVIHTVKHGDAAPGDWTGARADNEWGRQSRQLDELTAGVSEDVIGAKAVPFKRGYSGQSPQSNPGFGPSPRIPRYSEDYRHFDNLLWQTPAWSTAVLAISLGALGGADELFVSLMAERIENVWDMPSNNFSAGNFALAFPLYLVCAALFVFGFVFYRFHKRQISLDAIQRTTRDGPRRSSAFFMELDRWRRDQHAKHISALAARGVSQGIEARIKRWDGLRGLWFTVTYPLRLCWSASNLNQALIIFQAASVLAIALLASGVPSGVTAIAAGAVAIICMAVWSADVFFLPGLDPASRS